MEEMDDDQKMPTHRLRGIDDEMEFLFSNFFNSKYPILISAENAGILLRMLLKRMKNSWWSWTLPT